MIDGIEKRNPQLAFELQNSPVCEKRSKKEAEEGRRRVKFAKLVTSGDQEEDFGA